MKVFVLVRRRLTQSVGVFFVVVTVTFFMFRLVPGDPTGRFVSQSMSPADILRIKQMFGLDQPLGVQYLKYIRNIASGDFGLSLVYFIPVTTLVAEKLLNSLALMLPAVILAYAVGIAGGIYLAWKRGGVQERVGVVLGLLFRAAPVFWTGLLLLYVLAFTFPIFPGGGMVSTGREFSSRLYLFLSRDFLVHLLLPALTMTLYLVGLPLLLMKASMLEVIREDFIEMCVAKGLPMRAVMFRHAARNAILPVVTAFLMAIAFAFEGSVLIETIFSWPGLGKLLVDSVLGSDYPVSQLCFLIISAVVILANLLADILYAYLDPRIVYG